jgi:HK97 family phage major capsid protein
VQLIENAPTSAAATGSIVMVLGNLENSYIGTKTEMSVKILEEASVGGTSLAENDLSAIRVIERVGFDAGLTSAYSVVKLTVV